MPGLFGRLTDQVQNFGRRTEGLNFFGRQSGPAGRRGLFGNQAAGSLSNNIGVNLGLAGHPLRNAGGIIRPAPPTLEEQFSQLTGGLTSGPQSNLGFLVDQSGAVAGAPGMLNPRRGELANAIGGQFGLSAETGFNPMDVLTDGQLDLAKVDPNALRNLSELDARRLQSSNVLGADLLSAMLAQPKHGRSVTTRTGTGAPAPRVSRVPRKTGTR